MRRAVLIDGLQGLLHHQTRLRHVVKSANLLTDSLTSLIGTE
jgi:hypothetical protein